MRESLTGRPLAFLALAALTGVLLAEVGATQKGMLLIGSLLSLLGAWGTWRKGWWSWAWLMTLGVFATLHSVQLSATRLHPLRQALEDRNSSLEVEAWGRITQPFRQDLPGADPGDAWFETSRISCLRHGEVWHGPATLCLLPGKGVRLSPGEYRVRGWLRLPPAADNPGQFDARNYQLRLGVVGELYAVEVDCLRLDRWNLAASLAAASERCREWVTEVLSADITDRPNERAVILAMALGTTQAEARELQKPFRESGTLHIFSVSGLHVAALGFIFWSLMRPLGLRRGILVAILIPALFGYAFITGWRPSAVRAALMSAVFLLGVGLQRRSDLLNSLGAAALALMAADTHQVFAPGFQLSFGVIAAIGILEQPLTNRLKRWIEPDLFLPRPLLTSFQKGMWHGRRWFAGLFTVSTAALGGSLPLILMHFHMVTPISIVANVILVPLSFCVLGTALLTLLSGAAHLGFLQILFSNANFAFASLTLSSAQLFADVPRGNFYLSPPTLKAQAPAEITVLRLPEGAAAQHLRIGSQHWLLDTGGQEHFPFEVGPYLQYAGVNELHGLILSHSDSEHVGAALLLQREYGPIATWQPGRGSQRWDGVGAFRTLQTQGLQASPLIQGNSLDLGDPGNQTTARAFVLYPPPDTWARRSDDCALVLRLDLGGCRVLWCNDAGFLAEKTMMETLPPEALRCDVIIRNQHASDFSLVPDFLDAVKPRLIVSSNDPFPPEQELPQRLRDTCRQRNITLIDQKETGAVSLRVWPQRIEISSMRGSVPEEIPSGQIR